MQAGGVLSARIASVTMLVLFVLLSARHAVAGESAALTDAVRQTMALHFSAAGAESSGGTATAGYERLIRRLSGTMRSTRPAGVFVTLSREGKSRACWGNVFPSRKSVLEETVYATLGALTKEYRYPPIRPSEWRLLKPQVTVVRAVEPLSSLHGQNPLRDGLMVRSGGRAGVILPGEARDATYQLVQARLKAGLRPGQSYQLYRIIADVYQ